MSPLERELLDLICALVIRLESPTKDTVLAVLDEVRPGTRAVILGYLSQQRRPR